MPRLMQVTWKSFGCSGGRMVEISGIPWVEKTSCEDPVYSDGETCCRYGGETVDGVVVFGSLSNEIY